MGAWITLVTRQKQFKHPNEKAVRGGNTTWKPQIEGKFTFPKCLHQVLRMNAWKSWITSTASPCNVVRFNGCRGQSAKKIHPKKFSENTYNSDRYLDAMFLISFHQIIPLTPFQPHASNLNTASKLNMSSDMSSDFKTFTATAVLLSCLHFHKHRRFGFHGSRWWWCIFAPIYYRRKIGWCGSTI